MKAATRALMAALFLLSPTVGAVHCTEPITIAGTVTDDDELVDEDGEIYLIVETPIGRQLVENAGSSAAVTGTIREGEDGPEITVYKFEILAD